MLTAKVSRLRLVQLSYSTIEMPVLIRRSFSNNNNFSFSASFALSSGVKEISLNSLTHRFVNVTFQRKRRYSLDYLLKIYETFYSFSSNFRCSRLDKQLFDICV